MENEIYNSTFVNVTISAKGADGRYANADLRNSAKGNWVMTESAASDIKYIFPVKQNKILGVFESVGYSVVDQDGKDRIQFNLKPIFEGSHTLISRAQDELNKTNYVTKHFNL